MFEEGLVALLRADPAVAALIGARLYPVVIPENPQYPCASYAIVSGDSDHALDGTEFPYRRVQIDVHGTSYQQCKRVHAAIAAALQYDGVLSDGTELLGAFRGTTFDEYDEATRSYRVMTEYLCEFCEP